MRTNKLFLAAAALAAGVLGASAQSNVYSLNIVGYINVPFTAGQTKLVANQLKTSPDSKMTTVIPAPMNNTIFNKFTGSGFVNNTYVDGAWEGDNTAVSFGPGEGAYITASEAGTITFVGEVVTASTNAVKAGVSVVGSVLPQAGALDTTLLFPVQNNMIINQYTGSGFKQNTYVDGAWEGDGGGSSPNIVVAEAFFVDNPGALVNWVRNFTP